MSRSARSLCLGRRASLPSGCRAEDTWGSAARGCWESQQRLSCFPSNQAVHPATATGAPPESAGFNRDNPIRKLSEHFNGTVLPHEGPQDAAQGRQVKCRAGTFHVPRPRLSSPGHPASLPCLPGGTNPQAPCHSWTGSMRTVFLSLALHSSAGRMENPSHESPGDLRCSNPSMGRKQLHRPCQKGHQGTAIHLAPASPMGPCQCRLLCRWCCTCPGSGQALGEGTVEQPAESATPCRYAHGNWSTSTRKALVSTFVAARATAT